MMPLDTLQADLQKTFHDVLVATAVFKDEITITVKSEAIKSVCQTLHDRFGFEQLMDLCGVDYAHYGQAEWKTEQATASGFSRGCNRDETPELKTKQRYAVVYHLLSLQHNVRLRVKTFVEGEMPMVASVIDVWANADWYEREAFDLLGILFDGHPDLRRILTDYGFIGHPLRKDFPLSGQVEMRYDAEQKRVIYDAVEIAPRTLVPRVIRHDSRYNDSVEE